MKYFAKIDEQGLVERTSCVRDVDAEGGTGPAYLNKLFGGEWIETSKGKPFLRGNPAMRGSHYDAENDVFISPKPFDGWELGDDFQWQAPFPFPDDGKPYQWSEDSGKWINIAEARWNGE